MVINRKELIAGLITKARGFRFCGPGDDPDEQTAVTSGYHYLVTQFKRLVSPILSEPAASRLNLIEVEINNIYSAYEAKAELDALLPDIEDALEVADTAATRTPIPRAAFAGDDCKFARQAIEEARKSVSEQDGRPHPMVGAVVVKNGKFLSAAHRGEEPGNHAEFLALEKKLSEAAVAGATVYTTLEPCTTRNHPKIPCVARIIERKVARVVIGMLDPDKRIRGLGQQQLRDANIVTDFFPHDLMTEVEDLNREFRRFCEKVSSPESQMDSRRSFSQARYEEWRKLDEEMRASTRAMGYAFESHNVYRPGDPRNDPGAAIQRGHDALRSRILIADALKKTGVFEKWDELVLYAVSAREPRERGQRGAPTPLGYDLRAKEFMDELGRVAREDLGA